MTSFVIGKLPPPPEGTRYVLRQAGGHHEQNGDSVIPNLEHNDGSFLKFFRWPQRGTTELAFYQRVFDLNCRDLTIISLFSCVPHFKGLYTTNFHGKEVQFIKVEDITRRFFRPCILDVKLKADIHDPSSHHDHPIYTFAQKHGFLIDGIQVYHRLTEQYLSFGKAFGRTLDEDGVQRGLFSFLNADSGVDEFIVQAFLERLESIRKWASGQSHFSFYRSSLLLVYDAVEDSCLNLEHALSLTDIRMVDFGKVYASDKTDTSYEKAIASLSKCLNRTLSSTGDVEEKN